MTLKLFSFFHLNLAYSAIEVEQRQIVIERCYWPLLRLAKARNLPFGIEASAWTLETIAQLDPEWLKALRELVTNGPCEFIGCGYSQIIGPLVPGAVNEANFRIGMQRYKELLGLRPKIALVNEQAYSAGLVPLYRKAGYQALIMEWNNPARVHPEWDSEWRYLPQFACGPNQQVMPLIWNKSIAFQKFQRYVHGEIELDEYLAYVYFHKAEAIRAFPLYGNDVEVFDFRPGRYMTEAPLHAAGEWQRIDALYAALEQSSNLEFIAPSSILDLLVLPGAGNQLQLETAAQPVPVKKQGKYNLLRWAVTGRDDLGINTICWRLFESMQDNLGATESDWTELCYLWSSDFRTHITESRWVEYQKRLLDFFNQWQVTDLSKFQISAPVSQDSIKNLSSDHATVTRIGRFLEFKGDRFHIRFNCLRGLALEFLIDHDVSQQVLYGTLQHGYFDDIQWGADYYSGHLIFESPGHPRITDLNAVEPVIDNIEEGIIIKANIKTALGLIEKSWRINQEQGSVSLSYRLHWQDIDIGSLRLGYITLNPEAFDAHSLNYQTHNGGTDWERFSVANLDFDHGDSVSLLISANQALGITEGQFVIGDAHHVIHASIPKSQIAAVALVSFSAIQDNYLCRIAFSVREVDDTSHGVLKGPIDFSVKISSRLNLPVATR